MSTCSVHVQVYIIWLYAHTHTLNIFQLLACIHDTCTCTCMCDYEYIVFIVTQVQDCKVRADNNHVEFFFVIVQKHAVVHVHNEQMHVIVERAYITCMIVSMTFL